MVFNSLFEPLDDDVFGLTGDAKYNVIRNLLSSDEFAVLNQSQARNLFRGVGFTFQDSIFNSIYNEVVGISKLPQNIVRLGQNTIPSESYLVDRKIGGDSRYAFAVRYNEYDPVTDSFKTKFSTIYSNDLLTIGELENQFYELSEDPNIGSPPFGVQDAAITRGYVDRSKF